MGRMDTPPSYPLILRSLACVTNLFFLVNFDINGFNIAYCLQPWCYIN